jgi:hypothetical protein
MTDSTVLTDTEQCQPRRRSCGVARTVPLNLRTHRAAFAFEAVQCVAHPCGALGIGALSRLQSDERVRRTRLGRAVGEETFVCLVSSDRGEPPTSRPGAPLLDRMQRRAKRSARRSLEHEEIADIAMYIQSHFSTKIPGSLAAEPLYGGNTGSDPICAIQLTPFNLPSGYRASRFSAGVTSASPLPVFRLFRTRGSLRSRSGPGPRPRAAAIPSQGVHIAA